MLDTKNHDILLKKILREFFQDKDLQSTIVFKGGTCLYLFHNLDIFSTDLDFNIVSDKFNPEKVSTILKKYLTIEEERNKHFTWLWLGSYEKGKQKIKVEMSKRDYPDTYETVDFYGLTIPVMSKKSMFAHKLCAITDRKKIQNRDLYDTWFMFKQNFPIDENIVKIRTGKSLKEYFESLIDFINALPKKYDILQGLGEVFTEPKKDWVKSKLLQELLFELKIRVE